MFLKDKNKKLKKVAIIGAGPIGSYSALILAGKGFEVEIFEEHENIGIPFQCTGLVTSEIHKLIRIPEEIIINKISKIRVNSPKGEKLFLKLKNKEVVLDRTAFDKYIANLAKKKGVKINLSCKFIDYKNKKIYYINKGIKKEKEFDYLIGADGPNSSVRKIILNNTKIKKNIQFYVGAQASAVKEHDKDTLDTYFGKSFPGFFGWVVPTSKNTVRIGLASKNKARFHFENFVKEAIGTNKEALCEYQGGIIPLYDPQLIIKHKNIMILGDAATHVKATTGGGIIPGMLASKELINLVFKKRFYQKNIKNKNLRIHKQLKLHLFLRKVLDVFEDEDYNEMVKLSNKKNIKKILENENRDNMKSFALKIIFYQPKFIKFGIKSLIKS